MKKKCIHDSDCKNFCNPKGTLRGPYCTSINGGEDYCYCKCKDGWGGEQCELTPEENCRKYFPDRAWACDQGKNAEFGYNYQKRMCECMCKDGWVGEDCRYSDETTCNGNGHVNLDPSKRWITNPACICKKDLRWNRPTAFGEFCQYTPENTCNGRGEPQVGRDENGQLNKLLDPPCRCYQDNWGENCEYDDNNYCYRKYPNFECVCDKDKYPDCETYIVYNRDEDQCECDCWPNDAPCPVICRNGYTGKNCGVPPQGQCSAEECLAEQCGESAPFLCTEGQSINGCGPEDGWAGAACSKYCDTRTCAGGGNLPQCIPGQLCPAWRKGGPEIPCPPSGQCPFLDYDMR